MAKQAGKERKLKVLAEAVAKHEAEFGAISEGELVAQKRSDWRSAVAVRASKKTGTKTRRRTGI